MKPTTEGSKNKKNNIETLFSIVEKEEGRGIEDKNSGRKDTIFSTGEQEIVAEYGELLSNGTMQTERGNLIKFATDSYRKVIENRKNRPARRANREKIVIKDESR